MYPLFIPASVFSSDDLSGSSVSLSESSESDDESESSPLSLSISTNRRIGGACTTTTTPTTNRFSSNARVCDTNCSDTANRRLTNNALHNQQDHARAPHAPRQHHTGGASGEGSSTSDGTEEGERSSSDRVDAYDGTESDDDDDPNDVHPNPKLATQFLSAATTTDATGAIETDPDSESETESEIDAELFVSSLINSASSSSCGDSKDGDSEDGDSVMLDVEIGVEIPGAPGPRGDSNADRDPNNGNGDNHNDRVVRKELGDPAMMVCEGWDGALVFVTDTGTQGRGGVLDVAFERSSSWSRERARAVGLVSLAPAPTRVYDHVCWCYYCLRREDDERVIWVELASGSYCRTTGSDGNDAPRQWTHASDVDVDDGLGVCTERHRRSGGQVGGGGRGR